jgi:nucleotide-binding universal stress UspA family protein
VERILLAVDGGPASAAATEWVIERAKTVDISLEVTSVAEISWALPDAPPVDFRAPYEQAARAAAERVGSAAPSVTVTTVVRTGGAANALIAASATADLLVLGTNKTGRLAGLVHGTLPLRVAGRARCPTIVVPSGWAPKDAEVLAGWDEDETADVALEFAAMEADRLGVSLRIIHSWRVPTAMGLDELGASRVFADVAARHHNALSAVAGRTRSAHPSLEVFEALAWGPPAIELTKAASQASLIVLGTHSRGAIGGLMLGSVSHDVLMNMPAPVAVVPHPGEPIKELPEIREDS